MTAPVKYPDFKRLYASVMALISFASSSVYRNGVITMAALSSYLPNRWDWKPGQAPVEPGVTFRFADRFDIPQLRRFAAEHCNRRPSKALWDRCIVSSGYTVWVAVRNNFNIVGVIATRYVASSSNRVLVYGVAPGWMQERGKVWPMLLALACYEMPENPTELVVRDDDLKTQTALRNCGVVAVEKCSDQAEHHVFRYPAAIDLRSGRVVETGAPDRQTDR